MVVNRAVWQNSSVSVSACDSSTSTANSPAVIRCSFGSHRKQHFKFIAPSRCSFNRIKVLVRKTAKLKANWRLRHTFLSHIHTGTVYILINQTLVRQSFHSNQRNEKRQLTKKKGFEAAKNNGHRSVTNWRHASPPPSLLRHSDPGTVRANKSKHQPWTNCSNSGFWLEASTTTTTLSSQASIFAN